MRREDAIVVQLYGDESVGGRVWLGGKREWRGWCKRDCEGERLVEGGIGCGAGARAHMGWSLRSLSE